MESKVVNDLRGDRTGRVDRTVFSIEFNLFVLDGLLAFALEELRPAFAGTDVDQNDTAEDT